MGAAINNTAILRRTPFLPSVRTLTVGIAAILFVALCALPTIYMFVLSFINANGSFSFANYRLLLTEARQRELLLTTIQLGTGTAVLATAIGVPLGMLLARADLPAKRFLRVAFVVPLVLPSYMLALAWIYVGGSAGLVAQLIGRDLLSRWTYSLTGAILVLGLSLYPLSMLATEAAARRVEASLEEAALLVAGPRRSVWSITLPLIAPSIAGAALLTFVLALSEFSVPSVLRVRVFTTEVFTAFAALYDFGAATARATPMLALALIAGIVFNLVVGDRWLTSQRSTRTGLPLPLGRWRALAIAASALVLTFAVVLPLVVLALEAGRLSRVTTALSASVQAITNSLLLAVIGATLILVLGLALGYGRGRART
ncbi:MAG TPA: ABC transporter permease subunit, partial [Pyrinomonadaceae bacterium]